MSSPIRIFLAKFKEYIVLIFLLIFSLLLITLNDNSQVKNVRLYTLGIFSVFNEAVVDFSRIFEDTKYIQKLEKRNADLMLQVNQLRNYALENNELSDLLEFKEVSEYDLISAKIVSRLVSKISGYFIVSKGLNDGIMEGMPVITDKGLVGLVNNVADNYSTVRVFQNSLFKVAVRIERGDVDGVLNWDGRKLLIKNVPTTHDIKIGDRVNVSELSTIIPPSIPVGVIKEKESTLSGVLSNLVVKPYVNLNSVKNIMILKLDVNNELDSLQQKIIGG